MCGRFTLRTPTPVLIEHFGLGRAVTLSPRFNIAPTQDIAVVRLAEDSERELTMMRWGLIPSWSKDPSIANRLINARCETVAKKPAFRSAFRVRRCLVVADGFYEWQKVGRSKQPYHIALRDGGPLALAGLWESWEPDEAGPPHESCTIITTQANRLLEPIHNRMPVILDPADYQQWLDPQQRDVESLQALLVPFAEEALQAVAISSHVNSPRHDDARCLEPASGPAD